MSAAFEDPKARAGAIGMWTGIAGVGLAIGPTLGGVLTETFGWRSVFIINPIVSVIAIVLTYAYVSESRNPAHRNLDIWGQLLFIVAVGAITYALVEGPQKGWASPLILTCLIGSLVLAAVFVRVELHSHDPMMEVGVFRDSVYSAAIVTVFAVMFVIYGSMLLVTQYFQTVREYSPEKAGFLMLAMTLPTIVLAPIAGRVAAQRGGRGPTLAGVAAISAGTVALAVSVGGGTGLTLVGLFLLGTGAGLSVAPATNLAMTPIEPERAGMASGILSAQRALGSTAGFAIMGSVLAGVVALVLPGKLEPYISNPAERDAVASDVADTANPQAVAAFIGPGKPLPDTVQESQDLVDAADDAFVAGIRVALAVGFVVVTAAFVAGWIIFPRRRSREDPDEPPQGVVELTD